MGLGTVLIVGVVMFFLGYAAGRLSASVDYPKPAQRPMPAPGDPIEPTTLALVKRGRRIAAIRRFRRVYGTDLETARDAIEAIENEARAKEP